MYFQLNYNEEKNVVNQNIYRKKKLKKKTTTRAPDRP